ncbi:MAG: hypothetical protein ACE5E0_05940 [Terriglobia bacterium]
MTTSDEACRRATGKSFEQWFALLQGAETEQLSHKELARILREQHGADP